MRVRPSTQHFGLIIIEVRSVISFSMKRINRYYTYMLLWFFFILFVVLFIFKTCKWFFCWSESMRSRYTKLWQYTYQFRSYHCFQVKPEKKKMLTHLSLYIFMFIRNRVHNKMMTIIIRKIIIIHYFIGIR